MNGKVCDTFLYLAGLDEVSSNISLPLSYTRVAVSTYLTLLPSVVQVQLMTTVISIDLSQFLIYHPGNIYVGKTPAM